MPFQPDFIPSVGSSPSDKWRNVLGAGVIAAAVLGIGLHSLFGNVQTKLVRVTGETANAQAATTTDSLPAGGGDLAVSPAFPQPLLIPVLQGEMLSEGAFSADNILVKDAQSGSVLYHKNEYQPHAMASISKLMSALVFLETSPQWSATATVPTDDILDTHMYAGDTYTVQELWLAALVGSSNKAILALVDASAWSRTAFVERMNEKARELGMGDTFFVDPTGLSEENVSSASDILMLFREALAHDEIKNALRTAEHTVYSKERGKSHHMWNTNWLLLQWIPHTFEIHGGKTGYIAASGYNFVTELSDKSGRTLDVVVLGADTHEARFTEARDVATWVFEHYQWPETQK